MTVTDAAAVTQHLAWCQHCGHRPSSIEQRTGHLRRMRVAFAALPQPVTLLAATPADLRLWQTGLTTGPHARASAVKHARAFYRWAADAELADPRLLRHLVSPKLPARLPRPIPEADLARALLDAPPRLRPWLLLAAFAGLRACEVAPLRAEHLDLTSPMPTVFVADGKGGKQRVVPLGPGLVAELRACGLPRRGWLFPGQTRQRMPTGSHVSREQVSHLASKYLHEVGSDSTFHALRHRFATDVWAASLDLRLLCELLGHSSPRTAAGYAALVPGKAAAITAQISARLGRRPTGPPTADYRRPA